MATPVNNDKVEYHVKNGGSVTGYQCLFYMKNVLYHGNRLEEPEEIWLYVNNKLQHKESGNYLGGADTKADVVAETSAPTITFEDARRDGTVYIKQASGKYLRLLSNSEFTWDAQPLTAWLFTPPFETTDQ